jgi:PAS domain S-box-containing protein
MCEHPLRFQHNHRSMIPTDLRAIPGSAGILAGHMRGTDLQAELFSQLAEPFTGEALFDCLSDVVFFIKNRRGEYVVVNQTLVERCGRREKRELIGRRVDEVFPAPLGQSYRAQDLRVLQSGEPILNQLELHFYPAGSRGWCLTNKLPLRSRAREVIGLFGTSKDIQAANERSEDYSQVAQVIQHITTHYDQPLKLKELARRAGLSVYQFEQRIRRIFQITGGQLIHKVRMDAAVRRLRESDDSIASVALDCGYSDQSAFTRQFRQTTGFSPSQYRRASRQR